MGQNHNIEALQQLGRSFMALRQWRKARKIYRQILKIAPDHADALLNLAQIAQETGKAKDARAYLERLLAEDPGQLDALLLWLELLHQKEPQTALTRGLQALDVHPNNTLLHLRVAELCLQLKQNAEAARCLGRVQAEDLNSLDELQRFLGLLLRTGELKRAASLAPALQAFGAGQDLESRWQRLKARISPEQMAAYEQFQKGLS